MTDTDKDAEIVRLQSLLSVQDGAMQHRAQRIRVLESRESSWASGCLRWVEELNREHERATQLEARIEFIGQLANTWKYRPAGTPESPERLTQLACAEDLSMRVNVTLMEDAAVKPDFSAMAERVEKLGAQLRQLLTERETAMDAGK